MLFVALVALVALVSFVTGAFFIADLGAMGDFERDAIDFWENVSDFARELFWKWVSLF